MKVMVYRMIKFSDCYLDDYIKGTKLYGNELKGEDLKKWFELEANAYQKICPNEHYDNYDEYKNVTHIHLYRYLPENLIFDKVLVFGGGPGTEIIPLLNRLNNIFIIEPGESFHRDSIAGKAVSYIMPNISGDIDFDDNSINLITCFGVLHHIPNVEHIINEFYRVLKPNGYIVMREPITSMNIFTREENHPEMTVNERGIPIQLMRQYIQLAGLDVVNEVLYDFRPISFLVKARQKKIVIHIDKVLSKIFSLNKIYDARNFIKKFQAGSIALVLKKAK